ncbi:MAG: hypothetical protein ACRCU2_07300, partial [Planktothrix sp.]
FFAVPADTFDNVKGEFPIGFFIWNTNEKEVFKNKSLDIYDSKENFIGTKTIISYDNYKYISDWLVIYSKDISNNFIGHLASVGNDFQNQRMIFVDNEEKENWKKGGRHTRITINNLIPISIYFTVRKIIPATWLNDRDQFLYPNDGWQTDLEFQNDCLAFTLFSNNISSTVSGSSPSGRSGGAVNHWIPFTEQEVNAQGKFASSFMTDFIAHPQPVIARHEAIFGRGEQQQELFAVSAPSPSESRLLSGGVGILFSSEATAVFNAGRELWKYYHKTIPHNAPPSGAGGLNASLYDIREYFQGRNDKGRMNTKSTNATYTQLIAQLRESLKTLAKKIEPKVYEYGFLKE